MCGKWDLTPDFFESVAFLVGFNENDRDSSHKVPSTTHTGEHNYEKVAQDSPRSRVARIDRLAFGRARTRHRTHRPARGFASPYSEYSAHFSPAFCRHPRSAGLGGG